MPKMGHLVIEASAGEAHESKDRSTLEMAMGHLLSIIIFLDKTMR